MFGGIRLICLGDYFQLPPVGGVSLINSNDSTSAYDIFHKFKFFQFTEQMRASVDQEHCQIINDLRNLNRTLKQHTKLAAKMNLIYTNLTKHDIKIDHEWSNALIIVTANDARNAINLLKLKLFAQQHNRYIYRWKIPLTTSGERLIATHHFNQLNEIYAKNEDTLYSYFCREAPVFTNENTNPTNGLANGSSCKQHSIIPHEDDIACGFIPDDDGVITLLRPPYYLNIMIINHTIQKTYVIDGIDVIPIPPLTTIKPNIIYGLKFMKSTYELGFATTFHKVQGKTVNKLS